MSYIQESSHNLLRSVIPEVNYYDEKLNLLNKWWGKISLIGKINSQNVPSSILDEMHSTKEKFSKLQVRLINSLLHEHWLKRIAEDKNKSQVAIDTLIRNLFERTADVGFLATDDDIRRFLLSPNTQREERETIHIRLQEYVKKYSVYNEIIIFDTQGVVQANLDSTNTILRSEDRLLAETITSKDDYVETYRYSDMVPSQDKSLIYSCAIKSSNDKSAEVIGILCLSFKFNNEMHGIFSNLLSPNLNTCITINDDAHRVIASSNEHNIPLGEVLQGNKGTSIVTYQGISYISTVTPTTGYQGFSGLGWSAQIMAPVEYAFSKNNNDEKIAQNILNEMLQSELFSDELRDIHQTSKLVMEDLTLVVLNGIIASARQRAVEFMPVLEEIKNIGESITKIFTISINDLLSTVINSRLDDVSFRASLAVELMDRNLYERANDCRWWALTTAFKTILKKSNVDRADQEQMTAILQYINELYTVYTNLYLYDTKGVIVAVSNENARGIIGQTVEERSGAQEVLQMSDPQKYSVSDFVSSAQYEDRHTYIYNASITDIYQDRVIGGIGIVFDSEPEFTAMLNDTLPKDNDGNVLEGSFALYCQRDGFIVSASQTSPLEVGDVLSLDEDLFGLENGGHQSKILEYNDQNYTVGIAASSGYREYKTTNDYKNDILAFIFVPS